ncbi:MAG: InlB B-repeat-containing protein [Dehalococcoidaceae bacterium]|nr:InlB B-repeat-containing protein [Dehalococcoidaceae bacterium]
MKILIRSVLLVIAIALLLPTSSLHAIPPIAQQFYGSVTLDGSPAPDGTSVTAEMNGRTAGSDTTSGGQYSLTINTIEGDQAGDTIHFFVDGYSAGSTTLNPGGITQRNLSASSPPPQHTLTMAVIGQGSTNPSVGNHSYNEGQNVNISANPSNGWRFDRWEGDVANPNSRTTSVTIDGDKTVTAVFEEIPTYTLTMAVNGEGSVSPVPGSHAYEENDMVNISATPAEGWRFVNWSGDVADRNLDSTTVIMNDDKTVTANFAPRDSFTLTIDIEGDGSTNPAAGTHTYARDQVVEITATPAAGYKFDAWTGEVAGPASAATTVTINADKTVTARFIPLAYHELTIEVNGNGTTEPAPGEHSFIEGREVSISAIPAEGHRFTGWTGDVANPSAATTTVIMNSDKTVVANFEEGPPPPPVLVRIEVVFQTRNEAVIIWEFDKPITGSMEYRADGGLGQKTPEEPGFSPMHVTLLENLEPGTVYTYTVTATDEAGNEVSTDENTFVTAYNDARFIITGWNSSVE